ncbi:uncharacterized protein LOC18440697 [Amborella trichopoda]|uniref:Rab-GAP TBC domain-containing protein n=1 Tax=Amborella trichopoda TaxID=13333 RepID=W1PX22_AMBTC|nr:uncharacterized protein LOC18440697 [Amborella trichopoda]ERN12479.1 hypothetical protein AMTR_s00025p00165460 [Amborella trichopoda]|eukprot:XP_006850898.1 uncharacterized protein LOC18440697 [Amborella trichopoda]
MSPAVPSESEPISLQKPIHETLKIHDISETKSRFPGLRGVQWRVDLGILPSDDSSIDELRRVAANSRRRYATLRRRLLIDPHVPDDGTRASDHVMDNPLSQNPESMWSRFFRNAELERMVDQDLSRLYPEHGSYFQTPACQAMLRRILLLWSLRHPETGYRQGMHELLAPLLYVLHVDVLRLAQVRELHEDHFNDKFDGLSNIKWAIEDGDDDINFRQTVAKVSSLDELDPDIRSIVLVSDAYGAEGELGVLLSERFMEHDAYCMFDALLSGGGGGVAMADYFSPSPNVGSLTGLPPVIEASFSLYRLLSIVDISLLDHLVELGVEPQYFALRWLRVLFGREFLLEDLLLVWDSIFACDNSPVIPDNNNDNHVRIANSPREAFISAMAVSMLLHLRSSLLATETATACLQKLLNFPENIEVKKLIEKARSLYTIALDTRVPSYFYPGAFDASKSALTRNSSLSSPRQISGSLSPNSLLGSLPDSYWEEKWRSSMLKSEQRKGSLKSTEKKALGRGRLSLARAESEPSHTKTANGQNGHQYPVRRRLLEDLNRELCSNEDLENPSGSMSSPERPFSVQIDAEKDMEEETSGAGGSEESSPNISTYASALIRAIDNENDSEKSSVTSALSLDGDDSDRVDEACTIVPECQPLLESETKEGLEQRELGADAIVKVTEEANGKKEAGSKDRKPISGKFQWFWRFGRSNGEEAFEKGDMVLNGNVNEGHNNSDRRAGGLASEGSSSLPECTDVVETADKNVISTFRSLGQSMLENIQVIESVFQQERSQVGSLENLSRNILNSKGQVTAMAALKELRKISNLLSEM